MNPYAILGLSPEASDDEVKKAYRTLSKKYHPDANINNPNQAAYTEKFKEVQNAYKTIMDDRKKGFTNRTYTNASSSQGSYQQSYSSTYTYTNDQQAYQEAGAYIQANRFDEAMNILNSIHQKGDVWFYYAAICENGLGNNIRAKEYAQTACQMNPMNIQYLMLLQSLQGGQRQYSETSQGYGTTINPMTCCYGFMFLQCLTGLCFGGGYRGC